MTGLSTVLTAVITHGALGLACIVIVALSGAVVYLYKALTAAQLDRLESQTKMLTQQLEGSARLTAALVALKETIDRSRP